MRLLRDIVAKIIHTNIYLYEIPFAVNINIFFYKRKKCDAIIDCLDGSDESEATCGPRPNLPPLETSIPKPSNPFLTRTFTQQPPVTKPSAVPNPFDTSEHSPSTDPLVRNTLVEGNGCKQTDNFDVQLEILTCGDESDCDGQIVPFGTIMLIFCDGTPTPLQCRDDSLWHFIRDLSKAPRMSPCLDQDDASGSSSSNSNPSTPIMYERPANCGQLPMFSPVPWLVGLFRNEEFACTGTIIGPSLILTAGHCIVRNQASSTTTINAKQLKIQFLSRTSNDPTTFALVSQIELHPRYSGGQSPRYDVALLFLKENLEQKYGLSSACIDNEGKLLNIPAWTFNRTMGQFYYAWDYFQQTLDTSCFNKATVCSRHLNIGINQFCATNSQSPLYLHQGSSGGPYFIIKTEERKDKWTVTGIVSNSIHTSECGTPHTVFTSVSKLYDWIVNCGFNGHCSA